MVVPHVPFQRGELEACWVCRMYWYVPWPRKGGGWWQFSRPTARQNSPKQPLRETYTCKTHPPSSQASTRGSYLHSQSRRRPAVLVWPVCPTHVMAALSCSAATPDPAPVAPAAAVDLWAMKAAMPGSCMAAGSPMPSMPPVTSQHKTRQDTTIFTNQRLNDMMNGMKDEISVT